MSQKAALDNQSLENVSRTKLLTMRKFKGKEGFFLKTFFANTDANLNKWAVETQEALARDIKSGLDTSRFPKSKTGQPQTAPTIMRKDFAHPPDDSPDIIAEQEPDRVGNFIEVGIDEVTKNAYTVSEITNVLAIEMLDNNEIQFTSPSFEVISGYTNSKGIFIVTDFRVNHNALVKKPAFGTFAAQIRGRCTGDRETCLHQLSSVQATTCVKMKGENVCINTTNDEMEEVNQVESKCGQIEIGECAKTGNFIIKIAGGSSLNDCVQRILSKKLDKGEKPTSQDLAIAFSECRKGGKSESLKTNLPNRKAMSAKKGQEKDTDEMTEEEKNEEIKDSRATIKAQEEKIKDEKIVNQENAKKHGTGQDNDDLLEKQKKQDEEIQGLKTTIDSEIKGPLIAAIIKAKRATDEIKKDDEVKEAEKHLEEKDIEDLKGIKASYDAFEAKLSATKGKAEQAVRYTLQAAEGDEVKPGDSLLASIRGRFGV